LFWQVTITDEQRKQSRASIPVKSLKAVGKLRFSGIQNRSPFVFMYSAGSTITGIALANLSTS
jgi:hypothetical protein